MFKSIQRTLLGITLAALPLAAEAQLQIAPTRVVLEKHSNTAQLLLVNRGMKEAAYQITVENRRMLMDGSMVRAPVQNGDELFAAEHIRFSPRRIVMAPGAHKTVRISTAISNLEPGEYRSHLRVVAAPTQHARRMPKAVTNRSADAISIKIVAVRSLTIPVIVRVGELDAEVVVDDVDFSQIDQSRPRLVARLTRTGTKSSFGDLHVTIDGETDPIFVARGIAIYTPNTERDV
ncbi:MAG: hypothetical protein HRU11_14050, partial [Parvularculaceae bacterium]|nr:hypothetical protein [Parvularculaceae bacterium]